MGDAKLYYLDQRRLARAALSDPPEPLAHALLRGFAIVLLLASQIYILLTLAGAVAGAAPAFAAAPFGGAY
jgi:hypothetical protein